MGYTFPFYPPNSPKNENFNKMKNKPIIMILHKCTKNHDHTLDWSLDMVSDGCNCYFSFWAIFYPFTPPSPPPPTPPSNSPKNENFKKLKKLPGDIIISHVYQKLRLDDVRFLRYDVRRTDGQQKKWHREMGVPPKKNTKYKTHYHNITFCHLLNNFSPYLDSKFCLQG